MRFGFTPPTPAAIAIMIACVVVFIAQNLVIAGGKSVVTDWLALRLDDGRWMQVWRLVTYQYTHGDSLHIFFNLLGIYFFYPSLETLWGRKWSFVFYTAGGVFAGLAFNLLSSLVFPGAYLVGASGSILALIGACAVLFPEKQMLLLFFLVPLRVFAIVIGLLYLLTIIGERNLSNTAHLAGMLFGVAVAYYSGDRLRDVVRSMEQKKRAREMQSVADEQADIDRILAKVSARGMHSLSRTEQKTLKLATERQQKRDALKR
jgi:membrane associated rhomboid family serine protease